MKNWNFKWFYKIYKKRNSFLSSISWLISNTTFLFLFFAFCVLFFSLFKQDAGLSFKLFINLSIALALIKIIVDKAIKKLTYHPRPYVSKTDVTPIGKLEQSSTSPSGHTTGVVAAVAILIIYSPWFLVLIPLVPLIMWSRVYNGMHWPLDVFLGFILGLVFANLSFIITNLIFN